MNIPRFRNNIISSKMETATKLANSLLQENSKLMQHLKDKTDFKYGTNKDLIIPSLIMERLPLNIFTYKSFNPFSNVLGYYDGKCIKLNLRKLDLLPEEEIVGLLLHEYSHYCGFTHSNNYKTKDKCLYSVPYYLSENVKLWL